jgi:tight adherence protein C
VNPTLVAAAFLALYVLAVVGWRFYKYAGPELVVREGVVFEVRQQRPPLLQRASEALADRFAADVLARLGPQRVATIRRRLESAGRPNGMTLESYAGRKLLQTLIFGTLGLVLVLNGSWILGAAIAVAGWFLIDLSLRSAASKRQARMDRDLPDFLDILSVSVRAGLSFRGALARVAEAVPGPLSDEMLLALRKMELGESRRAALVELRDRNESEVLSRFIASLLQGEELGTPIADTLAQLATEVRREDAARARQRAARAAPRVSLVVTLIILPAAMLIMMTGMLISTDFSLELFNG